tara:strand:+ start:134 stop:742 length:609 start_codon:yes stop_codon:yes gene_type:complete
MNLVALIKPKKKLLEEVLILKKKIKKKFGKQTYLDHLVHLTIFDLKVKNSKITDSYKKEIRIKNLYEKDLKLIVKKRYFFKNDPITKKTTFIILIKKNKLLQNLQLNLLSRFQNIKLNKKNKFNKEPFKKNNNIYGYPFVNESWRPHITIGSIDKEYIKDIIFKNFLSSKKKFSENFKYIYFYKYEKNKHHYLWRSKIINDK